MLFKLSENWDIPCWEINDNLFIVFWSKTSERQKTSNFKYIPVDNVFVNDVVSHFEYGIGTVQSKTWIIDGAQYFQMKVDDKLYDVNLLDIEKQISEYQYVNVDPTDRLFIIFKDKSKHTSFYFKNQKFVSKSVGDLNTIKELVDVVLKEDGQTALLNLKSKWRENIPSDKQLFIANKKLNALKVSGGKFKPFNLNSLNMGQVSDLLNQLSKVDLVEKIKKFNVENCDKLFNV